MKDPILILHGWGSVMSGKRYREIQQLLEKKGYTVFAPDLPGFGSNTLKKKELFFKDYIDFVLKFLKQKKLKKVILFGHSFGGRIAIAFSAKYPEKVSKLILASASGIVKPLSFKKRVVQAIVKSGKPIINFLPISWVGLFFRRILYRSLGETDYLNAGVLSKTFKNVYRISVEKDLEKIKTPTLVLWGENDTFTPVADGMIMHKKIHSSKLVIIPEGSHKFPYEDPQRFVKEVIPFIS